MLTDKVKMLIEARLRDGTLPLQVPVQVLGGIASGDKLCAACDRHIAKDTTQVQEIFANGSSVFYIADCGHYVSSTRSLILAEAQAQGSAGDPAGELELAQQA